MEPRLTRLHSTERVHPPCHTEIGARRCRLGFPALCL